MFSPPLGALVADASRALVGRRDWLRWLAVGVGVLLGETEGVGLVGVAEAVGGPSDGVSDCDGLGAGLVGLSEGDGVAVGVGTEVAVGADVGDEVEVGVGVTVGEEVGGDGQH